jgi:hypothetical protein
VRFFGPNVILIRDRSGREFGDRRWDIEGRALGWRLPPSWGDPTAEAIKALEAAGLMSWDNRIKRVRERCPDFLGPNGWRWRVMRTSNAYRFPSESDFQRGTTTPDSNSSIERPKAPKNELSEGLSASFEHLWTRIQRKAEAKPA